MEVNSKLTLNVQSEVGKLEAVMLHKPGREVENMTPQTIEKALYSDILNLPIAQKEYQQLYGVLNKHAKVFEVTAMLTEVLKDTQKREKLIRRICQTEQAMSYYETLISMSAPQLAQTLIEGLPAKPNTLTSFVQNEFYALPPLYNFYFTRDASVTVGNNVLICKMANDVRMRESIILEAIFGSGIFFNCNLVDTFEFAHSPSQPINIEGGDVLIARDDILLVGNGCRTSTKAIDSLIERLCKDKQDKRHVIVQELPETPESFIHLDMVFTLLDKNSAMTYKPLVLDHNMFRTIHIEVDNGKVSNISTVANIPSVLGKLGMDIEPIICGGDNEWHQQREQWHSGANSFAIEPGKVLAYARNIHTVEALAKHGFEVATAWDIIDNKFDTEKAKRCVITIEGSELPRGGGGPRCMTMPLRRQSL
ncbi:MAG: arginine deiminase [Bacteroidales bacterium]|nr:MAG: arginine deiminase [Bacteroidales bacterium]